LAGQIELLKQQINPHFFFNSLNTLSGLVLENSPKTVFFIENLSMVFRYLLEIQEKNLVTVAEEINFAKAYIYLLKVRFDEKFSIDIQTESEHGALVPSSCTQLLLENCFKHNSMSNQQPLKIVIRSADGYLIVSNSVFQLLEVERNGIGLKNLNERSKLLTGKPIEIISNNNNFMVRVPLLKV
jgi:LytS/YehU family sensor histidine kinase